MLSSDSSVNGYLPGGVGSEGSDSREEGRLGDESVFESESEGRGRSPHSPQSPHSPVISLENDFKLGRKSLESVGSQQDVKITIVDKLSKEVSSFSIDKKASLSHIPDIGTGNISSTSHPRRSCTSLEKFLAVVIFLLLGALVVVGFLHYHRPSRDSNVCLTRECVRTASSLLAAMDLNADPCDNFFQFACGTWNKKHLIPEDRSSISTFGVMSDQLQLVLKGLLEEKIGISEGEATFKAKTFYASCMNRTQIETIGDKPLKRVLKRLGGWPVTQIFWKTPKFSVETLLGILRGELNQGVLVDHWVGPDDKNSSVNVIQFDQMQLGLQSRDIFLSRNTSHRHLNAYLKFMIDVAELVGATRSKAEEDMRETLLFETKLANVTLSEADRQDTGKNYMKLTLHQLQKEVPEFLWMDYLNAFMEVEIREDEPVVIYGMPYLKQLGRIMKSTKKRTLWNYALWRLVMEMTPHLTKMYRARRQEFRNVILGIQSDRNRWNRCVEWTNERLGMAVGVLFIKENFNHESKETAVEMIHNLRQAFSDLLEENEWMDNETRAVAREKANAMNEKIGYPEMLLKPSELAKEYETLIISHGYYVDNIFNYMKFEALKNTRRLRKPVDKSKWSTAPAVLNAFYNPNFNDIVFPAGILQPLFYSQHFPKSLNYGGIGVVIGHEMTHGFDDKGRQFDKDGNLKQWWNNRTIKAFRERAQCIIDQYSNYKVEEVGQNMNGRMTQGENIADNGGIKQAYRAYRGWVERNGEEKLLPGISLSHDQLFFLNYAQIWCGSMRPEDALMKIRSSVHSIGPIRVLGPLSNSEDFSRSFNCPPNSRMNARKKCYVW